MLRSFGSHFLFTTIYITRHGHVGHDQAEPADHRGRGRHGRHQEPAMGEHATDRLGSNVAMMQARPYNVSESWHE